MQSREASQRAAGEGRTTTLVLPITGADCGAGCNLNLQPNGELPDVQQLAIEGCSGAVALGSAMSSKRPASAHPDAAAAKRTPALPWAAEMLDGDELANLQSSLASVYSPPVSPPAQDAAQPAPASSVVDLTISDDEGGGATDEDEGGPAPPAAGGAAQPTVYSLEDDDIEIVVPGPRKAASPVASGSPTELGDGDDVIVALSSGSAIECMPHARSDCVLHRFRAPVPGVCNECDNAKVCPQCYCYVCDKRAKASPPPSINTHIHTPSLATNAVVH